MFSIGASVVIIPLLGGGLGTRMRAATVAKDAGLLQPPLVPLSENDGLITGN